MPICLHVFTLLSARGTVNGARADKWNAACCGLVGGRSIEAIQLQAIGFVALSPNTGIRSAGHLDLGGVTFMLRPPPGHYRPAAPADLAPAAVPRRRRSRAPAHVQSLPQFERTRTPGKDPGGANVTCYATRLGLLATARSLAVLRSYSQLAGPAV